MADINKLLERVADVVLRDQIRRQLEIQSETISNLESLVSSQRDKITMLESKVQELRNKLSSTPQAEAEPSKLFESDGFLWSMTVVSDERVFRPHCPQCKAPLNRVADFVECKQCSFEDILTRREPTQIPKTE